MRATSERELTASIQRMSSVGLQASPPPLLLLLLLLLVMNHSTSRNSQSVYTTAAANTSFSSMTSASLRCSWDNVKVGGYWVWVTRPRAS